MLSYSGKMVTYLTRTHEIGVSDKGHRTFFLLLYPSVNILYQKIQQRQQILKSLYVVQ